jgi:hypothetical protein
MAPFLPYMPPIVEQAKTESNSHGHGIRYILGKIFAAEKIKKEELMEKVKEMRDGGWHVSAEDYLKIIEYLKSL